MAFSWYKWEGRSPRHPSFLRLFRFFSFLAPLLLPIAPSRRFIAVEKGKAPLNEPELLRPKKRRSHLREMVVRPVVSRPWYERPPPGYPLPLYAHVDDSRVRSGERRCPS